MYVMRIMDSIWKKVMGIAGGLILINGVFLPWITVEKILDYNIVRIGTLSAMLNRYAYMMYAQYLSYALVALGFAFILALFIDEKHKITTALAASSFVLSVGIFGCLYAFVSDIRALDAAEAQSIFGFYLSSIDVGYGIYMCIIGSVIMLGSAFLIWREGRAVKKKAE